MVEVGGVLPSLVAHGIVRVAETMRAFKSGVSSRMGRALARHHTGNPTRTIVASRAQSDETWPRLFIRDGHDAAAERPGEAGSVLASSTAPRGSRQVSGGARGHRGFHSGRVRASPRPRPARSHVHRTPDPSGTEKARADRGPKRQVSERAVAVAEHRELEHRRHVVINRIDTVVMYMNQSSPP